jgi:hypothetical protein
MKSHIVLVFLSASLSCFGGFLFSGGNGQDLTVTLTQPLAIPFNAPSDGNSLGFVLVLEDLYSTAQPQQGYFPNTRYGSAGSITATLQYQNGSTLLGTDYAMWGTPGFNLGIIDPTDFIAGLQFQYASLPSAKPGDTLLVGAGTIVIPHFLGIVRPDLPVTTIQISNGSTGDPFSAAWPIDLVTVPEPTAAGLAGLGLWILWARRMISRVPRGCGTRRRGEAP